MTVGQAEHSGNRWASVETLSVVWIGLSLAALIPATVYLQGAFPIFTVIWLVVPLVVVVRAGDPKRIGVRGISWQLLLSTFAVNISALLLISLLVEPWSHAYQELVRGAVTNTPPDTTFAWLVRFTGLEAWAGLLLYSGLVTIFGEEVFFRGWLLQSLQHRMGRIWTIVIQAALFTLPQLLAALLLTPVQGVIYVVLYSFLGVGLVGGWAAERTQSIWPSLVSATIWNAIITAWVLR
ncbi:MAG: CPBP family intramembrane metalloprotease [Chloroflexi bacterium]|nr:CPBP family intramembrane metalloprotease [Chloroflexota bacterium]